MPPSGEIWERGERGLGYTTNSPTRVNTNQHPPALLMKIFHSPECFSPFPPPKKKATKKSLYVAEPIEIPIGFQGTNLYWEAKLRLSP